MDKREQGLAEADGLLQLGLLETDEANYEQALLHFHKALATYQLYAERKKEARIYNNIGSVHFYRNELEKADFFFHKALDLHTLLGNEVSQATALGNLGNVYDFQGEHRVAVAYYVKAIRFFEKLQDSFNEGLYRSNLGDSYSNLGQYEQAISQLEKAVFLTRKVGARRIEAGALEHLASTHQKRRNYQLAVAYYEQALQTYDAIGASFEYHFCLGNQGLLRFEMGQVQAAEEELRRSIKGCAPHETAVTVFFQQVLAMVLAFQEHHQLAHELLAPVPAALLQMPRHYSQYLCIQARAYALLQETAKAQLLWQQAEQLFMNHKLDMERQGGAFFAATGQVIATLSAGQK